LAGTTLPKGEPDNVKDRMIHLLINNRPWSNPLIMIYVPDKATKFLRSERA